MPRHHLIAAHALENRMHDRPDRCRLIEPILGFFFWQADRLGEADVHLEPIVLHEHPAPDDMTTFAHAGAGAATEAEIHRRLAKTLHARPFAHEMLRRRPAADFKDPDIIVDLGVVPIYIFSGSRIMPAPADVM